ncbi:putative inorganic phosphate cotransporter isoform X1 [Rhodnius prolixus]|uniref:Major facilitator superfamily (MFS) profile domain-containing protein n=1 Tax=Rhodnius prolixus TaxID=13249 RepID=A0A905Q2E7_RHOPR
MCFFGRICYCFRPAKHSAKTIYWRIPAIRKWHWFGVRHFQTAMLFLCVTVNYIMRINLGVAIVLMTDKNNTDHSSVLELTITQQSTAYSAFFWGYMFTNLMSTFFITKINNKLLLLLSVATSACATGLLPLFVRWGGFPLLITLRILIGLLQGVLMPGVFGQMSRWVPPAERGRCGALVLGGLHVGTLISFTSSGIIGSKWGWECIFYVHGIVSLMWCILWLFYGAESPLTCRYISGKEKEYIEQALIHSSQIKRTRVPWKQMLTNHACYAILFMSLANSWGYWTLTTQIPTYLANIFHYDASNNGLISAMPYACLWILSFPASYIVDTLIRKNITSITFSRKMCSTIAHWGGGTALVIMGYTSDVTVAICMYTLSVVLLLFMFMGHNINHLDICPNFAGTLMGITNGLANIASMLAPQFIGFVITDYTNIEQWRIVFYVSAAVFFAGNLLFLILGSGALQPFNSYGDDEDQKDTKNELVT